MTDLAYACVLVDSSNETSVSDETLKMYSSVNVTSVEALSEAGLYQVEFADVFDNFPVVSVTHHFNGGSFPKLNSVVEDLADAGGYPSDNAVVLFVARNTGGNYYCQLKTGGGSSGFWRSFSLSAMGPAVSG